MGSILGSPYFGKLPHVFELKLELRGRCLKRPSRSCTFYTQDARLDMVLPLNRGTPILTQKNFDPWALSKRYPQIWETLISCCKLLLVASFSVLASSLFQAHASPKPFKHVSVNEYSTKPEEDNVERQRFSCFLRGLRRIPRRNANILSTHLDARRLP